MISKNNNLNQMMMIMNNFKTGVIDKEFFEHIFYSINMAGVDNND